MLLVVVALGAVAVAGVLVLRTGWQARQEGQALRASMSQLRTHAQSGNLSELPAALAAVRQDAATLLATSSGWQWEVLTRVPVYGESAEAVPVLAGAVDRLAAASEPLAERLSGSDSTLALVQHLPELEPGVRTVAEAADAASRDLASLHPDDLRLGLDSAVSDATDAVASLARTSQQAVDAWPALSGLLGFDGPRSYLVMLQNPAESRGSGGLFSAFLRLTVDHGVPSIEETASRKALDDDRIPVPSSIDAGEQAMWGNFLTRWASFNTSADFPTTARLARAGMKARSTPVDGVIAIDPAMVAAVLAGTGPVEHQGVTIDAHTAEDFFTKAIYTDYPRFADVKAKDALALGLIYATVDSVLKRPLDVASLAAAVSSAIDGGHLRAWSPVRAEQQWLVGSGLAHSVASADPSTPLVSLNNATGGKLDAYVRTTVDESRDICAVPSGNLAGWVRSDVTVSLRNEAPRGLPAYVDVRLDDPHAAKGSTRILVTVQGPPGSVDEAVTTDGRPADYVGGQAHGRPYWLSELDLRRGEEGSFAITYLSPPAAGSDAPPCPDPVG